MMPQVQALLWAKVEICPFTNDLARIGAPYVEQL